VVLPRPNNRDSTNTHVQESVKSIFALFQGKAPDSIEKFPREVDKENSRVMFEVNSKAILSQLWSSLGEAKKKIAKSSRKKLDAANYSMSKFLWCVKNAMPTAPKSPVAPAN
jgi:hypothetical protein